MTATTCTACMGSGWLMVTPPWGIPYRMPCTVCDGRGTLPPPPSPKR